MVESNIETPDMSRRCSRMNSGMRTKVSFEQGAWIAHVLRLMASTQEMARTTEKQMCVGPGGQDAFSPHPWGCSESVFEMNMVIVNEGE